MGSGKIMGGGAGGLKYKTNVKKHEIKQETKHMAKHVTQQETKR